MQLISVVVPAYNPREHHLERCVHSLLQQDYPPDCYEIILIDDGTENRVIDRYLDTLGIDRRKRIKYYRACHRGAAVARNRGIELARGELVAFTDIDCVVNPNWLSAFDNTLKDRNLDAAGGQTLSYSRQTYVERYCDYFGSLRTPVVRDGEICFLIAANSCWRSEVLARTGGFCRQYGRYAEWGVIVKGYEDFDMSLRARVCGYRLGYSPRAIVYHQHRRNLRGRMNQFYHYGAGGAFFRHLWQNTPHDLGRYDLGYPPRFGRVLESVLKEALLLFARPFAYDDPHLSLDRRLAYPIFDFLQRLSFYFGFCLMSQRLMALESAFKEELTRDQPSSAHERNKACGEVTSTTPILD